MINYAAVTAIIEHHDSSSKNFYMVQDPTSTRWSILPWDLDHTWGNGCCNVNSTFVTPAETGDNTSALMRAILAVPEWRTMYFRRLRTLVNDILATGRIEALYDANLSAAQPTAALDYRGLAVPEQHHVRDVPHPVLQRRPGPTQRLRVGLPGAGQPAGVAEHRDRRDPALARQR